MAPKTKPATKPRSPLSRERVLLAAVALADEHGIASLSMRRLGDVLGVEAMSLYNHVANKDELLDGMVDLVFSEIDLPVGGADWKTAMRERAQSARQALGRHPWAIALMSTRTSPGPATLRHHDAVIGSLRTAGFLSLWIAAIPVSAWRVAFRRGPLRYVQTRHTLQPESRPGPSPASREPQDVQGRISAPRS